MPRGVDEGDRMRVAVRDAEQNLIDPLPIGDVAGPAVERHHLPASPVGPHFDVAPREPSLPARPQGSQHRHLGGPMRRKMLRCGRPTLAVLNFAGREDAVQKQFAVPFDHLRDAQALDDVAANAKGLKHEPAPQGKDTEKNCATKGRWFEPSTDRTVETAACRRCAGAGR